MPSQPDDRLVTENPLPEPAVDMKRPPRIWPLFVCSLIELVYVILLQVAVVVTLLFFTSKPGVSFLAMMETLPQKMLSPPVFTLTIFLSGFSMIVCALLFGTISARNRNISLTQRLGVRLPDLSVLKWAGVLTGSIPVLLVSVGVVVLIEKVIPGDTSVLQFYENVNLGWSIVFIITIGVMPGIGEELFFRGFIQRRMLQRYRPSVAIGITSVIFGLFHVTPHGIALATIIGVWLGVIAWKTNSIWPSACCHAFINSGWNVYQVGHAQWGLPKYPPMWFQIVGGLAVFIAFAWSVRSLIAMRPPSSVAYTSTSEAST